MDKPIQLTPQKVTELRRQLQEWSQQFGMKAEDLNLNWVLWALLE